MCRAAPTPIRPTTASLNESSREAGFVGLCLRKQTEQACGVGICECIEAPVLPLLVDREPLVHLVAKYLAIDCLA